MTRTGLIILVVGLGVLLVSLFADPLGIGQYPAFGRLQTLGTAAGALITVFALVYMAKRKAKEA